jgi:hypothetical protein
MKRNESYIYNHFVKTGIISIDDDGLIWREYKSVGGRRKHTIKTHERAERLMPNGYMQIQLYKDGNRITVSSHRLVWYHYNGTIIPDCMIIHHKDENRANNNIDNLKAVTFSWHNRHHKRIPWNKGEIITRSCSNTRIMPLKQNLNRKANWHKKTVESKHENYIKRTQKTYELYNSELTEQEVANILNVSRRTICKHLHDYRKEVMLNDPNKKNAQWHHN